MPAEDKPRILVVEDETLVADIVAEELTDAGYDVELCVTAEDALRRLEAGQTYDLLFTDIRLPGALDGWSLAEAARRLRPDLRVIYATGYSQEQPRQVPGSVFMRKPYRVSAVIQAARELGV